MMMRLAPSARAGMRGVSPLKEARGDVDGDWNSGAAAVGDGRTAAQAAMVIDAHSGGRLSVVRGFVRLS